MDSTYAPSNVAHPMPVQGHGFSASMPPSSSVGSGAGSLQHSPYHQSPMLQHQQPQSHHSRHNSQAQASVHQYEHQRQHQYEHSHTHQLQQQQQGHLGQSHPSSYQSPSPQLHHSVQQQQQGNQPPVPPPSQQSHTHNTHHQLHLNRLPSQSQQLPPNHLLHHQPPSHITQRQPKHQTQLSSGVLRPEELFNAPISTASIPLEPQIGNPNILLPLAKVDELTGRKYQLDVVQQPRRARMCGFGDKDRRPITPPPCVRLVITDMATGREIDCNDIDYSMFVLNVDLWNEEGTREVNLVRSSANSPSIAPTTPRSTTSYSYATQSGGDAAPVCYGQAITSSRRDITYDTSQTAGFAQVYQTQPGYNISTASFPPNGTYGPPQQFFPQHHMFRPDVALPQLPSQSNVMVPFGRNGPLAQANHTQDQASMGRMAMVGGQPQGMFTRNLIGSLAASAFRLSDTSDKIGIWFVLQDLSVRTEGPFRLRFSFVNVAPHDPSPRDGNTLRVNTGRAPILASCFSDVFNVYSAKKFPGVCESTPLSKMFATQGIKIPIRKDANAKGGDGEDDYGD